MVNTVGEVEPNTFEELVDCAGDHQVLCSVREHEANPGLVVVAHVQREEVLRGLWRYLALRLQLI